MGSSESSVAGRRPPAASPLPTRPSRRNPDAKGSCNATCEVDTTANSEFSETDCYYSNQGEAGTCVRHAVAKGMQREIKGYTGLQFHTSAAVQFLVNASNKGADGCWPTDFQGTKGQVIGPHGKVYEVDVWVRQCNDFEGHVWVLELNKLWKEYEPGHDMHAVFSQYKDVKDGNNIHTLRNSWGHYKEKFKIRHNHPAVHSCYYVKIRSLIKKGFHAKGEKDIVYCENGKWNKHGS